jgi:ligand-binding sensor domain-containing protein
MANATGAEGTRAALGLITLSFLISTLWTLSAAATPQQPLSRYIHAAWQTDAGLPQNNVQAILQSRDGYLWLATQEGLARFDGIRFTVFDKRNTAAIKENNIQALYEDRAGNLWFGTEGGGLCRMKDGSFVAYTIEDGLADNIVEAIYEDHEGSLWVGTLRGLNRLSDGRFTTYGVKDGLGNETVLAIYEDRDLNLWVGTEGGLSKRKDGRFVNYNARDGLANPLVRSICEDRSGILWIATREGLNKLERGRFSTLSTRDGLLSNSVHSVYVGSDGKLWIGSSGGLNRLDGDGVAAFTVKDGLTDNGVASVYEDAEGNIWIGTYGGGLNRLRQGKVTAYAREAGLLSERIQAIFEDRKGNLWIGTYGGGLNRLTAGRFSAYGTRAGLSNAIVLSLAEDSNGNLWIGTNDGLNRLKDGRFSHYKTEDGLTDNTILSILEDRKSRIWVGTAGGLNRFDGRTLRSFTTEDGLSNESVSCLLEDRDGNLWIGTDGGGLNKFKNGSFSAYTVKDGLSNNLVLSLYEDREGTLWIGTSNGLNRLKDGSFTAYTVAHGLFDDVVFQILEDRHENLWISCNTGIFRVNKRELKDVALGKISTVTSISYGTADGMKSRECNGGFQPAGWKSRDGRLWFPTIKGLVVIDPDNIKTNERAPPVVIEQLTVDGQPVMARGRVELAPGREKLDFHYTGLSFQAPEKVRFKYLLDGFDKNWVDAGSKREASYMNIPPGRYVFRVKASNNDGVWNETGASFEFYLKPYFYQTYWIYLVYGTVAGLIVWGGYRLRVRRIETQFAAILGERNRIAREIHDTLAQGFAGISVQLESVEETMTTDPNVAKLHLDLARGLVRSSLAEARRTVWDLRSPSLENGDLTTAVMNVAQQLSANIPIQVTVSGASRRLPPAIENNLFHMSREALTNAVKHARARQIVIELVFERQQIRLRIVDDGRGFDPQANAAGLGFGLTTMAERAQRIGARLAVSSQPGEGTEVVIVLDCDGVPASPGQAGTEQGRM